MSGGVPSGGTSMEATTAIDDSHANSNPLSMRQLTLLVVWTLLADLALFRAVGFSGPAAFMTLVPLMFLAKPDASWRPKMYPLLVGACWFVALRLAWLGNVNNVLAGIACVVSLAFVSSDRPFRVLEGLLFSTRVWLDGLIRIIGQGQSTRIEIPKASSSNVFSTLGDSVSPSNATRSGSRPASSSLSWLLPIASLGVFGSIFVFANPDLLDSVSGYFTRGWNFAWDWFSGLSMWEIPFCLAAFVAGAGLLWPALPLPRFGPDQSLVAPRADDSSPFYTAFRNTLVTLIVLFAAYLVFEFVTLWRREFPPGFYYAGYAHQGAAWLTFALALATGLLSMVFSGRAIHDRRLQTLRRLSWGWSGLNFLLAVAVYNRLMIYVGYNGMTRMRTVGFFGITLVVIGFGLVVFKIARNRGFWWLIRSQLLALSVTIFAYGLFPVDWVAHQYNAWRVQQGQLHPSVMIAMKPMDDSAIPVLLSLVDVEDEIIREGVLAKLAGRHLELETHYQSLPWHWTRYQFASRRLYSRLDTDQAKWRKYLIDPHGRLQAIDRFEKYAMQWY